VTTRTAISVVVPATDEPPTLDRCRAALARSDDPAHEVLVVDGPPRLSASAARNTGARQATGDVVVFVDADVEVHPDALARIRAAFDDDPELTAVHGSYDDTPDARSVVSAFRNLLHHHVHQTNGGPADTFWTGLGAVRRDVFLASGGFDEERYPHPSVEDIELGHRLRRGGARILLDPAIQGTHLKRWTLRSMVWTDFARRGVPWMGMHLRERSLSRSLNLGWRHRATALLLVVAAVAAIVGFAIVSAVALVGVPALNHDLYRLLVRRQGALAAIAGVALHVLHHVVAMVAAGVAVVVWAASGFERVPATSPVAPLDGHVEPEGLLRR
jgi:GT2 family glycosyltransferase